MPAAQFPGFHPRLGLFQHGYDLFFAESTLSHDSSSDPGRVILNGESHISNGLVSGEQVNCPSHLGKAQQKSKNHPCSRVRELISLLLCLFQVRERGLGTCDDFFRMIFSADSLGVSSVRLSADLGGFLTIASTVADLPSRLVPAGSRGIIQSPSAVHRLRQLRKCALLFV
jgi:hypothetical protein